MYVCTAIPRMYTQTHTFSWFWRESISMTKLLCLFCSGHTTLDASHRALRRLPNQNVTVFMVCWFHWSWTGLELITCCQWTCTVTSSPSRPGSRIVSDRSQWSKSASVLKMNWRDILVLMAGCHDGSEDSFTPPARADSPESPPAVWVSTHGPKTWELMSLHRSRCVIVCPTMGLHPIQNVLYSVPLFPERWFRLMQPCTGKVMDGCTDVLYLILFYAGWFYLIG